MKVIASLKDAKKDTKPEIMIWQQKLTASRNNNMIAAAF